MENKKNNEGKYIYGIIRHQGTIDFGPIGIGKRGDQVYGIGYKDICAIVSNSPLVQYEARRANLTAHELVLEEVMKHYSVLPVRFSTIADINDDADLVKILERDYNQFSEMLTLIDRKKELGLKVTAIEKNIFGYILEKHSEIREMKEKIMHLPPDKTHYQRMKIGEMVSVALQKEKELLKERILEHLTPFCEDSRVNDNYGDRMVLNASFLVCNNKESEFDKAVFELDEQLGELLNFKYVGNLPPYNFVNMAINIENKENADN